MLLQDPLGPLYKLSLQAVCKMHYFSLRGHNESLDDEHNYKCRAQYAMEKACRWVNFNAIVMLL